MGRLRVESVRVKEREREKESMTTAVWIYRETRLGIIILD